MRNFMGTREASLRSAVLAVAGILLATALSGCGSSAQPSKPAEGAQREGPQRYALTGRVVSVAGDRGQVVVDADDIPGFMMAMTMGYPVKNPKLLDAVSAEDRIKADVVVQDKDYWLENIVVVKKGGKSPEPASGAAPPPPAKP